MSTRVWDRRAAIAAYGAFALLAAAGSKAARRSPAFRCNIRVDVAPLRANAGDPTAAWVERELPRSLARALAGRSRPEGNATVDRLSTLGSTPGPPSRRLVARSGPGRGDARRRSMAGAGDFQLRGLADRPDDGRAIQPLSGRAGLRGAGVLDRSRSWKLKRADRQLPRQARLVDGPTERDAGGRRGVCASTAFPASSPLSPPLRDPARLGDLRRCAPPSSP